MEIDESLIEYRSYNYEGKIIEVPILLINKGTLLFRYVYDIPSDNKNIKSMSEGSFLGINLNGINNITDLNDIDNKTYLNNIDNNRDLNNVSNYCLPMNYNVFFYPYPYIMDTNKYLTINKVNKGEMILFETTKDIKVVLLLPPSQFKRIGKKEESEILTTCDNYNYCGNLKGFYFDACFKKDFLESNMDIMGYYGISNYDSKRFLKSYNMSNFKPFKKFISFYKIDEGLGIPELVLYPRSERSSEDINLEIQNNQVYNYIKKNQIKFNYKMINTFKHFPYSKNDELYKFLNTRFKFLYTFNPLSGFYINKKVI